MGFNGNGFFDDDNALIWIVLIVLAFIVFFAAED
jgi:hypothetical protein